MRRDDPGRHSGWDEGMRERVVVKEVPVERVVEKEVRVEVPKIVLQPIDVVREITVEVVNEVPKEIVREVPIIEIREVDAGYESEEDTETAEEKRLRLAKVYLAEIEEELAERKDGQADLTADITERLQEDVAEEQGKVKTT